MIFNYLFPIVLGLTGLFIIIGTLLRMSVLVDPSSKWIHYSHSILKKHFGSKFLVGYNYFIGLLFLVIAIIDFWLFV